MRGTLISTMAVCLLLFNGCNTKENTPEPLTHLMTLQIEIDGDELHLGHSSNETGGHSVWCDGLPARLLPSKEAFMIYSINRPISEGQHRFEKGHRYEIRVAGTLGNGVMGYKGKCVSLEQISEVDSR